jgi:PadR family transcriptional regulator PadR
MKMDKIPNNNSANITKPDQSFIAMKRGLLEFIVLKSIDAESMYADELLKFLEKTEFSCPKGTLYPLLQKLLNQNLILQHYDESEIGPPRKYYFLTGTGIVRLKTLHDYWKLLNHSIENINLEHIVMERSGPYYISPETVTPPPC